MKIVLREVVKRFGSVTAVDRASLDVGDGELFTLLGPSGCGKTTLLRLVAGFYRPDAGEIVFGERVVNALPPYERNIGMVFQNYALWPHMTVFANVAYGLRLRKLGRREVESRVMEGLRKVNLSGLEGRYPGQLSGGQQQRVALARALVLNPDFLLLDEPLSNLDAKIRVQVRAEIRKLQKELGITALYVTHDQEEALSLSDRVAVMRDGKVLQVGAPKELYERPLTRFVADFVGTNNFLQGTVRDRRGAELLVETALGSFRAMPNSGIALGAACVLAIRPENVAIGGGPAAAPDGNVIRGRVAFASYLGNTLRYDVEVEGGQVVKADIRDPWHHEPFALGQAVAVSFPPSVTLAIADDTA
ncbi:MAG: spermidine/putrescine ABC transporter ATP-binding protein [Candidatus Rokubacteria bacterium RIFCSPLOWO2_12_FULL_69_21]|nr:MAG: spermidine/putrescine ABC transporter ATP-binding protein [Candidatus Rokubacteria bacterium RIFCSPLOWO2_12_FULL_69_21]